MWPFSMVQECKLYCWYLGLSGVCFQLPGLLEVWESWLNMPILTSKNVLVMWVQIPAYLDIWSDWCLCRDPEITSKAGLLATRMAWTGKGLGPPTLKITNSHFMTSVPIIHGLAISRTQWPGWMQTWQLHLWTWVWLSCFQEVRESRGRVNTLTPK